tara:strand:+ start:67 stop:555 length:489 start_codon:yes stop_codon:yes gene_type:complete
MPRYNYECLKCKKKAYKKYKADLIEDNSGDLQLPTEIYEALVIFETSHSIEPAKKELEEAKECPRCQGTDCEKTLYGTETHSYIRGYGFLDRAGAKRDMNRFKLKSEDPYGQYRVAGEVDYIDNNLKKGGKHDPKTKYFPAKDNRSGSASTNNEPKPNKDQD